MVYVICMVYSHSLALWKTKLLLDKFYFNLYLLIKKFPIEVFLIFHEKIQGFWNSSDCFFTYSKLIEDQVFDTQTRGKYIDQRSEIWYQRSEKIREIDRVNKPELIDNSPQYTLPPTSPASLDPSVKKLIVPSNLRRILPTYTSCECMWAEKRQRGLVSAIW